MTLDLTRREVKAWIAMELRRIDAGLDPLVRREEVAGELALIELFSIDTRVPNAARALRMLVKAIDARMTKA